MIDATSARTAATARTAGLLSTVAHQTSAAPARRAASTAVTRGETREESFVVAGMASLRLLIAAGRTGMNLRTDRGGRYPDLRGRCRSARAAGATDRSAATAAG